MAEEKGKARDTRYRPRLAIPVSDVQTMEWLRMQSDVSASVRRLIRESIAKYGMVDIDCLPVKPGVHPGRPRKGAVERAPIEDEIAPEWPAIAVGEEAEADGEA